MGHIIGKFLLANGILWFPIGTCAYAAWKLVTEHYFMVGVIVGKKTAISPNEHPFSFNLTLIMCLLAFCMGVIAEYAILFKSH